MADANSVSSGLATLGGGGWNPSGDPRYGGAPVQWSSTWANRPQAGQIALGQLLLVTDVGPAPGMTFRWDGARWRPDNGVSLLAQNAVPQILPSSGNSNATGQITLTTALPYQPSGTVGLYLPAGVVTGGSQGAGAGVYQVQFSSTSVCQLTGNGIVTANGAYAQPTGVDAALGTIAIPAGLMGPNGALRLERRFIMPNNANNKTGSAQLGGQLMAFWNTTATSVIAERRVVRNRNAQNLQAVWVDGVTESGGGTFGSPQLTVDTSVAQNLVQYGRLAVATDYMILEGSSLELLA